MTAKKESPTALTTTIVEKLQPRDKAYDVRDTRLIGFYVRVEVSGTKTFRCIYRRGKHYTIGRADKLKVNEAREMAREVMGQAARGIDPNEKKKQELLATRAQDNQYTFSRFLNEKYELWYRAAYPKTAHATIHMLKENFEPLFGRQLLSDITLEKVENWRSKQQVDRRRVRVQKNSHGEEIKSEVAIKPATLNRYIERLSAFLSKAVEYGCLAKNPILGIKKLKVSQANRIRFLAEEEYVRLVQALDQREREIIENRKNGNAWRKERHRALLPDLSKQFFADYLKPMVLIALGSGVRFGSLVRLQWDKHVDMHSKDSITLKLTPDIVKTENGYEVPLDGSTSKVVYVWYQQTSVRHHGKGWVFPGKKPEHHITTVKKSWKALLETADIEDFHWHDIRHDYASQHVMSGTDLYTVMELLGHTDPKMTKKYAHLASEHKKAAAKQLDERRQRILKEKS